jgi:hypothetical protein
MLILDHQYITMVVDIFWNHDGTTLARRTSSYDVKKMLINY